jgi:hypothetical protein
VEGTLDLLAYKLHDGLEKAEESLREVAATEGDVFSEAARTALK